MFTEECNKEQSGEAAAEGTTRSLYTVKPGYRKQKRRQQKELVNNLDAVRSPCLSPPRLAPTWPRAAKLSPPERARALSLALFHALLRAHSL